jgi:hypothetical protein
LLDDEPVVVEAKKRNADEILGASINQPRLALPRHRGAIPIDERNPELASCRLLLLEDTNEVAKLGLAKGMLLPKRSSA